MCRTEETGEGESAPRRRCAEPDCLKWKFLRHENAVPFTADGVRDRKVRFQMGGGSKCKWDSNSRSALLSHARRSQAVGPGTHLQVEMVSCLTEMLLYPNPCNYLSYSTCVSTHVQHYSRYFFFFLNESRPCSFLNLQEKKKPLIIALIVETIHFSSNWTYRVCFIALITQASENEACLAGRV